MSVFCFHEQNLFFFKKNSNPVPYYCFLNFLLVLQNKYVSGQDSTVADEKALLIVHCMFMFLSFTFIITN